MGDLAQRIKAKYPEYADMPDAELEQRTLARHPEYADMASGASATSAPAAAPTADTGLMSKVAHGIGEGASELGDIVKGIGHTLLHPIDSAAATVGAHQAELSEANDRAARGDKVGSLFHTVAGSVPLIGPMAGKIYNQSESGDTAGAIGRGVADIGSMLAPEAAARIAPRIPVAGIGDSMETLGSKIPKTNAWRMVQHPVVEGVPQVAKAALTHGGRLLQKVGRPPAPGLMTPLEHSAGMDPFTPAEMVKPTHIPGPEIVGPLEHQTGGYTFEPAEVAQPMPHHGPELVGPLENPRGMETFEPGPMGYPPEESAIGPELVSPLDTEPGKGIDNFEPAQVGDAHELIRRLRKQQYAAKQAKLAEAKLPWEKAPAGEPIQPGEPAPPLSPAPDEGGGTFKRLQDGFGKVYDREESSAGPQATFDELRDKMTKTVQLSVQGEQGKLPNPDYELSPFERADDLGDYWPRVGKELFPKVRGTVDPDALLATSDSTEPELATEYAHRWAAGSEPPPIEVLRTPDGNSIIGGHHRATAAGMLGREVPYIGQLADINPAEDRLDTRALQAKMRDDLDREGRTLDATPAPKALDVQPLAAPEPLSAEPPVPFEQRIRPASADLQRRLEAARGWSEAARDVISKYPASDAGANAAVNDVELPEPSPEAISKPKFDNPYFTHYTAEDNLPDIMREGLLPRSKIATHQGDSEYGPQVGLSKFAPDFRFTKEAIEGAYDSELSPRDRAILKIRLPKSSIDKLNIDDEFGGGDEGQYSLARKIASRNIESVHRETDGGVDEGKPFDKYVPREKTGYDDPDVVDSRLLQEKMEQDMQRHGAAAATESRKQFFAGNRSDYSPMLGSEINPDAFGSIAQALDDVRPQPASKRKLRDKVSKH